MVPYPVETGLITQNPSFRKENKTMLNTILNAVRAVLCEIVSRFLRRVLLN